jgi:hypothetical protein
VEHSAGRAAAPEHRDGHPDELVPEADPLGPHQADAHPPVPCAWDAWDGALPDATDEADLHPAPLDAGAEKLAVRVRDVPAQDARFLPESRSVPRAQPPDVAAALCTPDAAQSAEQSCAAPEAAAVLSPPAQQDAAVPPEPERWQML